MIKIINGKKYSTETAQEVGVWCNNYCGFDRIKETLYCKKTGEYFVHGEGGANTRYAESIDKHTWSNGERIIPLTLEQAKKWAEDNLDAEDYESIFGEVEE